MISEGTIIANSSAPGSAAISVIRLSGEDSIKIVNSFFKPKNNVKLIDAKSHTVNLGILNDGKKRIDEVLISVFKFQMSKITPQKFLDFFFIFRLYFTWMRFITT